MMRLKQCPQEATAPYIMEVVSSSLWLTSATGLKGILE